MKQTEGIKIKTDKEIEIMTEGGGKLATVKEELRKAVRVGVNAQEIDRMAESLIVGQGGKPSFKMVPRYHWTTCVNINEGIVHGIPKPEIIFKDGDLVSVDVGMFYNGFHTDTSFSVGINVDKDSEKFLKVGKEASENAIKKAVVGNRIYDISSAIEKVIRDGGCSPVRALVGHGVGRELHEEPQIPCFVNGAIRDKSPVIQEGMVLAIEVMYAKGSGEVKLDADGWTISSSDGTITGLFEETVAVTNNGPKVLT